MKPIIILALIIITKTSFAQEAKPIDTSLYKIDTIQLDSAVINEIQSILNSLAQIKTIEQQNNSRLNVIVRAAKGVNRKSFYNFTPDLKGIIFIEPKK